MAGAIYSLVHDPTCVSRLSVGERMHLPYRTKVFRLGWDDLLIFADFPECRSLCISTIAPSFLHVTDVVGPVSFLIECAGTSSNL